MPFGLANAPAVFQALEDILIFSCFFEEHKLHVHQVLQGLLENQLFVKAEKYEFHCSVALHWPCQTSAYSTKTPVPYNSQLCHQAP